MPDPAVSASSYHDDLLRLYEVYMHFLLRSVNELCFQDSALSDVIFVCGSVGFSGHKFLLSAGSEKQVLLLQK